MTFVIEYCAALRGIVVYILNLISDIILIILISDCFFRIYQVAASLGCRYVIIIIIMLQITSIVLITQYLMVGNNWRIICPQVVYNSMSSVLKSVQLSENNNIFSLVRCLLCYH